MYNLSVIVPHYNSHTKLERLIKSIPLSKGIQLIIVDDNSEDYELVEGIVKKNSYKENIILKRNPSRKRGAGICRNAALNYVEAEWVLFADADDFFLEDFYKNIEKYLNGNNDIVFFPPTSIFEDTGVISDRHLYSEGLVLDYLKNKNKKNELRLRFNFEAPWSKLIKIEFVNRNQILFDETPVANDILFSSKIGFYAEKIEASYSPIYCITKSANTLTTSKNVEWFRIRLNVYITKQIFLNSVLSADEIRVLRPSARGILYTALKDYGIAELLYTLKILRENHIRLMLLPGLSQIKNHLLRK